jgi:hypothetical protein
LNRARLAALATALAIAAGAFEPFYFKVYGVDRAKYGARLDELPYRRLPGLRRFLFDVRERTKPGDIVGVIGPLTNSNEGYLYLYGRAIYHLAGRRTLPLLDERDRLIVTNIRRADYIAAWHAEPPWPGFTTVWRSEDGVLMRSTR